MPPDDGEEKHNAATRRLNRIQDHLNSKDDGVTWKHAISTLEAQKKIIHTPNTSNPGYIRQREAGKLWVHDRIVTFLDSGSFKEIGSITGKPIIDKDTGALNSFIPGNIVIGWGKLEGRRLVVTADDFSVRGGHADGGVAGKAAYAEELARKARVPLVRMLDGSSGGGSVRTYLESGRTYIPPLAGLGQSMDALSVVPVASALLGPVVGLGAAKAVMSHFSVMVKGLSQLFAAGPPVVKQATFEDLSKENLGGWEVHSSNGTVDNVAISENDAFMQIRQFLSFLPSSMFALPPLLETTDSRKRREEELISIIPRRRTRSYDIRKLIRLIVDIREDDVASAASSTFFELGVTWGRSIVTGFARLEGRTIGLLSSDCTVNGGVLDAYGNQKTTRFVDLCDHFSIPVLNLVDQPGFAVGSVAENMATIRHGASAISALYHATVPIFTVVIRRCFGVAGSAFSDPNDGWNVRVAWPSGDWGSLPLEGGIEAAYKGQLDAMPSPAARDALMADLLKQFEDVRSPMKTAYAFGIEEIIDPRDTRPLACEWVVNAYEQILPQRLTSRRNGMGIDGKARSQRGFRP